jgi:acyl carrier protein
VTIEQDLQQFIGGELLLSQNPSEAVSPEDALLSSGRVDSLGLLQILSYVESRYGVALLENGSPRDFETIQALAAAIRRTTHA